MHGEQEIFPLIYKANKCIPPIERHRDTTEPEKHKRHQGLKCSYYIQFGHNQRSCKNKLNNITSETQVNLLFIILNCLVEHNFHNYM